ncbi:MULTISPECIES: FtsH protease activity modulator HflK [Chromohalobacter]|uniref:Protein HflK n=1 Tax=Chromohalobacter israelensis (strain ATCC BAA-138 / DSM 3043 / CIP 106854 / NCIMB 13768 / 1H11) TaxID=290398 RepID=Q1QY24_CHRI1|nr:MULTISPECIES: FtsH protease activity modulator HflK [Chromohalobacter]ABE58634.1 protease FtsH subunit HflK [Chromohalobacter salexigens DSM 3043]MBZ5875324.1 FtsH protease activity modulator HflK [Chromohalobacter salexigens]MDF9433107.1 FtsH protease activity modulator HflK [Chromohalobacter israelensis]MDO0944756.1 FtsH protease activity modulator HflK [Chromohalobacter salexigens]NQY44715.1 FtsH protease activity modulator HflK [Chromohalobacter sp.]
MAWNEPGGGNQQDPWSGGGGRRGSGGGNGGNNQGPPDLDEALKKFQDKLSRLMGKRGKRGGDGNGGASGGKGNPFILPAVLTVLALVIWAGSGFYRVDQSERGVVLRFGEYHETVGPGLHWNPTFVDQVTMVNVTEVRSFRQDASMLTSDTNIVTVRLSAQYQVSNPRDYVLNVRNPEQSLRNALDSTLRHVVGASGMQNVLTSTTEVEEVKEIDEGGEVPDMPETVTDPSELPVITMTPPVPDSLLSGREELGPMVAKRLQESLDAYGLGLRLQTVNLESTQAPEEVQEAVDDVIRSREDRQRLINEARAYENALQPRTEGNAQRLIEEATGYRNSVVADAQGQTSRFLSVLGEYQQAPEVTRQRLYLDTLSDVLGNNRKALLDVGPQNNSMIYLPLDQLRQPRSSNADNGDSQEARELESISQQVQNEPLSGSDNTSSQRQSGGISREGR